MWPKEKPETFLNRVLCLHKIEMLWQCNTGNHKTVPWKPLLKQLNQTVLHGINLEFQLMPIICYQLRPSHLLKPKLSLPWLFPWTIWRWKQFVSIIWFNVVTNHSQKKVWIEFVRLIISEAWQRRGLTTSASMINADSQDLSWSLTFPGKFKVTSLS